MASDYMITTTQISGITGSIPVCTRIEFQTKDTNTGDQSISTKFTESITDNNPNISKTQTYGRNVGDYWRVVLYGADDSILAQSE
jgi:hypothetical protein